MNAIPKELFGLRVEVLRSRRKTSVLHIVGDELQIRVPNRIRDRKVVEILETKERWIRNKAKTEPDFDLQAYLTMLLYYKTGMADLKFSEEEDKLLYKMKNPDEEMHQIVDQLIKSLDKSPSESSAKEKPTSTTEDADGTPDS